MKRNDAYPVQTVNFLRVVSFPCCNSMERVVDMDLLNLTHHIKKIALASLAWVVTGWHHRLVSYIS